jgi:hypothetical protein
VFVPAGSGLTLGQVAPADIKSLADFLTATGWKCLYGINFGGAWSAATGGTYSAVPATVLTNAAAEVLNVHNQLGSSLIGIEIGNEPDDYGGTYFPAATWSVSHYEPAWLQFYNAIVAAVPGVPVTGPANGWNVNGWTVPFSNYCVQNNIPLSLLTQHYYIGQLSQQTPPATIESVLSYPDPHLISYISPLQASAASNGIPYRVAEANTWSDAWNSTLIPDTYTNALWIIDFLFTCAQYNATGVNIHGGGAYSSQPNEPTPIVDNGSAGTVMAVRPEFYGMLFFNLAGTGTLNQTTVSAGSLNVSAYAVQNEYGAFNVMLVNKDLTNNLEVTITLPQKVNWAGVMVMSQLTSGNTGPDPAAVSGITIQGASVSLTGAYNNSTTNPATTTPNLGYTATVSGSTVTCYVPALSAVLIELH